RPFPYTPLFRSNARLGSGACPMDSCGQSAIHYFVCGLRAQRFADDRVHAGGHIRRLARSWTISGHPDEHLHRHETHFHCAAAVYWAVVGRPQRLWHRISGYWAMTLGLTTVIMAFVGWLNGYGLEWVKVIAGTGSIFSYWAPVGAL